MSVKRNVTVPSGGGWGTGTPSGASIPAGGRVLGRRIGPTDRGERNSGGPAVVVHVARGQLRRAWWRCRPEEPHAQRRLGVAAAPHLHGGRVRRRGPRGG